MLYFKSGDPFCWPTLPECINYNPWRWTCKGWNMLEIHMLLIEWWFNDTWVHLSVFDTVILVHGYELGKFWLSLHKDKKSDWARLREKNRLLEWWAIWSTIRALTSGTSCLVFQWIQCDVTRHLHLTIHLNNSPPFISNAHPLQFITHFRPSYGVHSAQVVRTLLANLRMNLPLVSWR
jgi:hypothetical protein